MSTSTILLLPVEEAERSLFLEPCKLMPEADVKAEGPVSTSQTPKRVLSLPKAHSHQTVSIDGVSQEASHDFWTSMALQKSLSAKVAAAAAQQAVAEDYRAVSRDGTVFGGDGHGLTISTGKERFRLTTAVAAQRISAIRSLLQGIATEPYESLTPRARQIRAILFDTAGRATGDATTGGSPSPARAAVVGGAGSSAARALHFEREGYVPTAATPPPPPSPPDSELLSCFIQAAVESGYSIQDMLTHRRAYVARVDELDRAARAERRQAEVDKESRRMAELNDWEASLKSSASFRRRQLLAESESGAASGPSTPIRGGVADRASALVHHLHSSWSPKTGPRAQERPRVLEALRSAEERALRQGLEQAEREAAATAGHPRVRIRQESLKRLWRSDETDMETHAFIEMRLQAERADKRRAERATAETEDATSREIAIRNFAGKLVLTFQLAVPAPAPVAQAPTAPTPAQAMVSAVEAAIRGGTAHPAIVTPTATAAALERTLTVTVIMDLRPPPKCLPVFLKAKSRFLRPLHRRHIGIGALPRSSSRWAPVAELVRHKGRFASAIRDAVANSRARAIVEQHTRGAAAGAGVTRSRSRPTVPPVTHHAFGSAAPAARRQSGAWARATEKDC